MDLTSLVRPLAAAANASVRLLSRQARLRLRASASGLVVSGGDRDLAVRFTSPATTHVDGEVLVPAAPFAETVRMLDVDQVRLVVEGSRLAIRMDGARFALPLLDRDLQHDLSPPDVLSEVDSAALAAAVRTVAGTAAKDDPLPLFTGVRVQSMGDELRLTASDRYRMAVARLPLRAVRQPIDVLVPAALLTEATRCGHGVLGLHADAGRFGLSWEGGIVTTAVLDAGFLSEEAIPSNAVDTEVELNAEDLAAAVRRVGLYAADRRLLTLEVGDAHVRLASARQDTGEAEETLKASVCGGRTSPTFQPRYLQDALTPFASRRIRLAIQPGLRACILTAADERELDLTYYLMPLLPR
ncbi:DNA polymerase III subunit beta [Amycolatopsis jiangsuensis]|uniref:DNA polymerase-3 subunit beta n=1 Tax=Amycolatopsis jiangsuensis TaxID=1181879 RepID=A0A840J0V5_9PSEU|nr:DNA polymerase III subunit beta [Amycolatopsis jiangsuensis]MBB4687710.1 DNA polymerase-3 subunit beta [Amycolatopsis jiangsuensis]